MKRLAVALVAVLALSACGAEADSPNPPADATVVSNDSDSSEIYKIDVDGTTCIVLNEYNRAALSCDWNLTTP